MFNMSRKQKHSIISAVLCLCMVLNVFAVSYLPGFASTGVKLSGDEKLAYDALVPIVRQIANGERSSTVIEIGKNSADAEVKFTEHYSEFDLASLKLALMRDLPFEMYWSNTKCSMSMTAKSKGTLLQATFKFGVAANYQGSKSYTVDASMAALAVKAAKSAQKIVEKNANKSDYAKLVAYRDYICGAVSYDDAAIANGSFYTNNDPWQMISVFDGNSKTNVVCEGYARAFQYLCDLSSFEDDSIACYTVSGKIECSIVSEEHCWNIVTIGGKNYLVDLANCDAGTVGRNGGLFLAGSNSARTSPGYRFKVGSPVINVDFYYDEDTTSLWGNEVLKLAYSDYKAGNADSSNSQTTSKVQTTNKVQTASKVQTTNKVQATSKVQTSAHQSVNTPVVNSNPTQHTCTYTWVNGNAADQNGHTLTCKVCRKSSSQTVAHTYSAQWTQLTAPTCTTSGEEYRVCTVCGYKDIREIAALGHSLIGHSAKAPTESTIGWNAYVDCARCNYTTYSELSVLTHTHRFSEWTAITSADCTTNGLDSRSCSSCGYSETRVVKAQGHELVHHSAQSATCTENGHNAYDACTRCDFTTYEEHSANGHNFGEWVEEIAPKCSVNGVERRTCTSCGHSETRAIEALCLQGVEPGHENHHRHMDRDEEMHSTTLYHLCG